LPKPSASPEQRLVRLREAEKRARKFKQRDRLTARPMAELLGVSWDVLRGWCNDIPGFERAKCFTRGQQGIEWEFKPLKTTRFLISHFEKVIEDGERKVRREIAAATGGRMKAPEGVHSIDDLTKVLRLSVEVRAEQERRAELVEAQKVVDILGRVFTEMQAAGLRAAQQLDPNGRWPPETRAAVDEAVRSVMVEQQRQAQDCLKELNGSSAQPGKAGAGYSLAR